jgi:hypothetical protein
MTRDPGFSREKNVVGAKPVPPPEVWRRRENSLHRARQTCAVFAPKGPAVMIYVLAFFLPPLALLLNGQPFSALLNFAILLPCILLALVFPVVLFVPSAHAIIAIYMAREDRKHREIVQSIERHGVPPGWRS